jgi:hypothetical protein
VYFLLRVKWSILLLPSFLNGTNQPTTISFLQDKATSLSLLAFQPKPNSLFQPFYHLNKIQIKPNCLYYRRFNHPILLILWNINIFFSSLFQSFFSSHQTQTHSIKSQFSTLSICLVSTNFILNFNLIIIIIFLNT